MCNEDTNPRLKNVDAESKGVTNPVIEGNVAENFDDINQNKRRDKDKVECDYKVNPVIKRIAVKADCTFKTPALIGSGFGENTDSDILRRGDGSAFLPGSTTAGVLKSLSNDKTLLGELDHISPLWVYDAELKAQDGSDAKIIELNGVELGIENKVAKEMKKFDYEAVDAGTKFTLRLLLTIRKKDKDKGLDELLLKLLSVIKSGEMAVGGKTRRGFGRVTCEKAEALEFELTSGNTPALEEWLNFDWNTSGGWTDAKTDKFSGDYETLTAVLKLNGSVMVRDTRNIYDDLSESEIESETVPDFKHISVGGKPVILGTSWAGAFRSGLHKLLSQKYPHITEQYLECVFGIVKEQKDDTSAKIEASKVIFGASYLEKIDESVDGYRSITRVKIDRFTGGAASGALFSEKPWYGGKTELEIRYLRERCDIRELILLGLDALGKGLIQIGGETAVGRGFVSVERVADSEREINIGEAKQKLIDKLKKIGGETA
jgi:CRISPR/Cas system CSM-associated protein Csm3 (group 7 of RAMP superfamily)